jgi:tetrahydromethanopterin S-methyltransferase subunit D
LNFILTGRENWNSARNLFYTAGSGIDRRPTFMAIALAITQGTVQIVAGAGAVILIALAIMRHKSKSKKEADDEF